MPPTSAIGAASGPKAGTAEPHSLLTGTIEAASPNRNLTPISTTCAPDGALVVGGCRLSDLARTYDTPLYVLDEDTLRASCRAYREALDTFYPGRSLALYASKANSSLAITALVASEGLGLDAVSSGELLTALGGGMPPERIVLHGNNKSAAELALAVEHGVTVVADNWRDLELLATIATVERPAPLMLRFTPGIECHTHEYIRTGHLDSKFGFDPDQLEQVLRQLAECPWARLTGLHAHIGSQIFELQPPPRPGRGDGRCAGPRSLARPPLHRSECGWGPGDPLRGWRRSPHDPGLGAGRGPGRGGRLPGAGS